MTDKEKNTVWELMKAASEIQIELSDRHRFRQPTDWACPCRGCQAARLAGLIVRQDAAIAALRPILDAPDSPESKPVSNWEAEARKPYDELFALIDKGLPSPPPPNEENAQ